MKKESYPQLIKTMWININKKKLQNQKNRKK